MATSQRQHLIRRIHAIGRALNPPLDHDGLTDAMQVRWPNCESLRDLPVGDLHKFAAALEAMRPRPRRSSRPRGKRRDPDTITLASANQRNYIHILIKRDSGTDAAAAFALLKRLLGDDLHLADPPESIEQFGPAIHTMSAARVAINGLIGDLKRKGLWN